jgi:hypothetical protein
VYSYVPKTIPLSSNENPSNALPTSGTNGTAATPVELQQDMNKNKTHRSSSRSRSVSSKGRDQKARHRSSSAQKPDLSAQIMTSSQHRNRHHHSNGTSHVSTKHDHHKYGTISHSSRKRSTINIDNHHLDREDETKRYLKQLIEDMQAIKVEMSSMRQTSAIGATHIRSDSLRVNLKELRHDIDSIRARMAMTPKIRQK